MNDLIVGVVGAAPLDDLDVVIQDNHRLQSYISLPEDPTLDPVGQRVSELIPDESARRNVEHVIEFFQSQTMGGISIVRSPPTINSPFSLRYP